MGNIISWRLTREIAEDKIAYYENMLENLMPAIDLGKDKKNGTWVLNAFFDATTQPKEDIIACVGVADSVVGVENGEGLSPVYQEDWIANAKHSFPALEIGRFFLHSFNEEIPEGMVGLKIPAGLAFGTGEHPTTAGCLTLYESVIENNVFNNCLDMGAGSGVLSIAAVKVQNTKCTAIDIDEESVTTCIENIKINDTSSKVSCTCGDGFKTQEVAKNSPYDLIMANILMQPLLDMSSELVHVLDDGGTTILSGFLVEQEGAILKKYTSLGLTNIGRFEMNNWVALSFIK